MLYCMRNLAKKKEEKSKPCKMKDRKSDKTEKKILEKEQR